MRVRLRQILPHRDRVKGVGRVPAAKSDLVFFHTADRTPMGCITTCEKGAVI